jgi:SAM-dependent methyltransferase
MTTLALHRRRIGRDTIGRALAVIVASVWLYHGLFNKLLRGEPRHLAIVQAVPGLGGVTGEIVLALVGGAEVFIAIWVTSGVRPCACAAVQTIAVLAMNALELSFARDHLLWPATLVPANLLFLSVAWIVALQRGLGVSPEHSVEKGALGRDAQATNTANPLYRLRRHPLPVRAHFDHSIVLTYALPAPVLEPLLPPGLMLDTCDGYGFVAVAIVQTRDLRPTFLPRILGRDFVLTGYRIFTRFKTPAGRTLRGLRILRSDADRALMVAGGNLLTHYNYRRCDATISATADAKLAVTIRTPGGEADVDVIADLAGDAALPPASPFRTLRDARKFAGPLPYTFDYEPQTHSIISIKGVRENWSPRLVNVDVRRLSFFDHEMFRGVKPILASAFHVHDIPYRWERGVRHALLPSPGTPGEGRVRVRAVDVGTTTGDPCAEPSPQPSPGIPGEGDPGVPGEGEMSRRRASGFQGVLQIARFNWPLYMIGLLTAVAALLLPLSGGARTIALTGAGVAVFWLAASLIVSHIVYDRSPLRRWTWITSALGFMPTRWVNLHAGLDESTPALRRVFPTSSSRAFDFFDAGDMTERSILRARRLARNEIRPQRVDFRRLPLADESVEAAMLLLSAHELRTRASRVAFFNELRRALAPGGKIVLAEHLRDWKNFLAFGPGFLHFFSRREWRDTAAAAGLLVEREISITPFVGVLVLVKQTMSSRDAPRDLGRALDSEIPRQCLGMTSGRAATWTAFSRRSSC